MSASQDIRNEAPTEKLSNLSIDDSKAEQKMEVAASEVKHDPNSNFPDPNNFAVRHHLQNEWTLWFDSPGKEKKGIAEWANNLKEVITFDTVEDFWRIFNNIQPASKLMKNANYHLFKKGVEPAWEHVENKKGGKWIVACKTEKANKEWLDKWWLWTILACIGETFDDESEICGCVVSIRPKGDKISLWTKTANKEQVQKRIGYQLKRVLELPENAVVGYTVHADSIKNSRRSRYEV